MQGSHHQFLVDFTTTWSAYFFCKLTCLLSVSEGLKERGARRDAIIDRAFIGLKYWGNTL